MAKINLTKQEFQDKILLKVQEEAKRTGRPEIDILNEVAEKMKQRMEGGLIITHSHEKNNG